MSVLIFIEVKGKVSKAALEAVSYGSKIGPATVVTYGKADDSILNTIGEYGGEKILIHRGLSEFNDQKITNLIMWLLEWYNNSPPSVEYIANELTIPKTSIESSII